MTGSKNKARAQAKLEKRASAQAKAAAEREAANAGRGAGKNRDKGKGKAGSKTDAVAEAKACSKSKVVAETKEGARPESKAVAKGTSDFNHKAENKYARSARKDKPSSDSWFWAGEDSGINSWFWKGEEVSNNSVAKCENKPSTSIQARVEEHTPRTSHKSRSGAEEEEEENVIGNWFWEGDDTGFDSDPKPVFKIVKPQPVDEINEKDRPKDWSEVTIWPKAPAVTPAVLGYRSQDSSEGRPSSYIVLASNEEETSTTCTKNTRSSLQPIPEYPFGSDPCIQTLDEIRQQIKIREENGIKPFACPCKMECYLDSPEFEKLVNILKSTTDPLIHKIAQIAMGIHKVHPFAQEFINEVGVVTLIESLLSFSSPEVSIKKAVITLNSSGDDRQQMVEFHVKHMCKETVSFPLNSPGQQSGLKIIGQLTTESVHHYIVVSYFSELFHLLSQGNRKTRNLVLKVFLNMSENPKAARDMINMKALAALKLIFNQKEAKANLVSAVAIFINIKEHIRKGSIVVVDHLSYNTLTAIFREVKGIIERM